MVECPNCHYDVAVPYKTWTMRPYKNEKHKGGRTAERTIGLFNCPRCTKKFRKVIKTDTDPEDANSSEGAQP